MGCGSVESARTGLRSGCVGGRASCFAAAAAALLVLLLVPAGVAAANPAGQWSHVYAGPGRGNDAFVAVTTDPSGNAYAAGSARGAPPVGQEALLASYRADGSKRWVRLLGAPAGGAYFAADVVCDSTRHIWVAGGTGGSRGDVLAIRYSTMGARLWQRALDFSGKADRAVAMATDAQGCGYIAADCTGAKGHRLVVYKLSRTGRVLWRRTVGRGGANSQPADILVNGETVVVCGWERSSSGSRAPLVAALTTSGSARWTSYDASASGGAGEALALSASSTTVWVTGKLIEAGVSQRSFVSAYGLDGVKTGTYETPAGALPEHLTTVAAEADGTAWVGGTQDTASGPTAAIHHLVPAGTVAQSYVFPRTSDAVWADSCVALCADDGGSVWMAGLQKTKAYVTGFTAGTGPTPAWWGLGTVPASPATVPNVVSVGAAAWTSGAVYLAGAARAADGHSDALLIRFSPLR